jgi:hypothetical protein
MVSSRYLSKQASKTQQIDTSWTPSFEDLLLPIDKTAPPRDVPWREKPVRGQKETPIIKFQT